MAFVKTRYQLPNTCSQASLLAGWLLLFFCLGCQSCPHDAAHTPASLYSGYPHTPLFIFERLTPQRASCPPTSPPNLYPRPDWPLADAPTGYIDSREIITYREDLYSDQSASPDNNPRQYYHRRLTGYRFGAMYR